MERSLGNSIKKIESKREIPNSWFSPTEGPRASYAFSTKFVKKFGEETVEDIIKGNNQNVQQKTGFSIAELKAKIKELERK